jgi:hypothetical protein
MPFASRPDVKIDWLFYAVPIDRTEAINTVVTDRFFDDREHWFPPSVGVVPFSLRPYFGPVPPINTPLSQQWGTAAEWLNGLDYQTWIEGGYSQTPCWDIYPNPFKGKAKGASTVSSWSATPASWPGSARAASLVSSFHGPTRAYDGTERSASSVSSFHGPTRAYDGTERSASSVSSVHGPTRAYDGTERSASSVSSVHGPTVIVVGAAPAGSTPKGK